MNAPELSATLETSALRQILELGDGDTALLREMITIFKEDTPGRLGTLRTALEACDAASFGAEAHALKGAAGTMGAQRMRTIAFAMEQAGKTGCLGEPERALYDQLCTAYEEALAAMEAYADQCPPS